MSYLTIIEDLGRSLRVRCVCGTEFTSPKARITSGHKKSCGCKKHGQFIRHGQFVGGASTHIVRVWRSMIQRCKTPTNSRYKYYGGRGIKVCERWKSFNSFIEDMGPCPGDEYSIERIDVNKGYNPENCKWILKSDQPKNTRSCVWLEFNGERMIQSDWARRFGVSCATIGSYIHKHGVEKAMNHYSTRHAVQIVDKSGQFIHLNVPIINGRSLLRKGVL